MLRALASPRFRVSDPQISARSSKNQAQGVQWTPAFLWRNRNVLAYASTKPRSIAHAKQLGIRVNEATIDRARKAVRPSRQRSYDRSRTQISSAIRGNEPSLPRMAELI